MQHSSTCNLANIHGFVFKKKTAQLRLEKPKERFFFPQSMTTTSIRRRFRRPWPELIHKAILQRNICMALVLSVCLQLHEVSSANSLQTLSVEVGEHPVWEVITEPRFARPQQALPLASNVSMIFGSTPSQKSCNSVRMFVYISLKHPCCIINIATIPEPSDPRTSNTDNFSSSFGLPLLCSSRLHARQDPMGERRRRQVAALTCLGATAEFIASHGERAL